MIKNESTSIPLEVRTIECLQLVNKNHRRGMGMGTSGPATRLNTDTMPPTVTDLPLRGTDVSGLAASRDSLEVTKLSLEVARLQDEALGPEEVHTRKSQARHRDGLELAKLSAENDKLVLELAQLQGAALDRDELRERKSDELVQNALELQKLRREARNAKWAPYFEFAKTVVPALTIAGSIYIAWDNITYQQNRDRDAAQLQRARDRSVEVSQLLVHFHNQITAMTDNKPDISKQRNAIAAVRSLGKDAIPSLLANLDLDHDPKIWMALHTAVLELNEDGTVRPQITRELLSAMKYTALRPDPDVPHLDRYVALWRECLQQYARVDKGFFHHAVSLGNKLADDLKSQVRIRFPNNANLPRLIAAIDQIRS